jgi:hypothetical protein
VDALQTQAILAGYLNPDKAQEALERYMEVLVPPDPGAEDRDRRAQERMMQVVANMEPIKTNQIVLGNPIGGSEGGSIFRR